LQSVACNVIVVPSSATPSQQIVRKCDWGFIGLHPAALAAGARLARWPVVDMFDLSIGIGTCPSRPGILYGCPYIVETIRMSV
jgi:hypothetical protein